MQRAIIFFDYDIRNVRQINVCVKCNLNFLLCVHIHFGTEVLKTN